MLAARSTFAATSRAAAVRAAQPATRCLVAAVPRRAFADRFKEREAGFESQDVLKHDRELLEKLRKEQSGKDEGSSGNAAAADADSSDDEDRWEPASAAGESVTLVEFLEFRRDIVQKIRSLEDEVTTLRMRLKK